MMFGKLRVIEIDHIHKKHGAYWLCLCDCGSSTITLGASLRSGNVKSCGCYVKEQNHKTHFIDMDGQVFGKLKVLKFDYKNKKHTYWICQCQCGNTKSIDGTNLRTGVTLSCGCLAESYVASYLKRYLKEKYNAVSEYKILKIPKQIKLFLMIYMFQVKIRLLKYTENNIIE